MTLEQSADHGQRGATLAEVTIALFLLAVAIVVASPHSLRWLGTEASRSAAYETQMLLQLARAEAVTRNRSCRFEIDAQQAVAQVWDLNDPGNGSDDVRLAAVRLPSRVRFSHPEGAAAITLQSLGGSRYGATFRSDGVATGAGYVVLEGNASFRRLSVYAAGGTKLERWGGSSWLTGS